MRGPLVASVRSRSGSLGGIVEVDVERPAVYVKRGSGATIAVNLMGSGVKVLISPSPDPGLLAEVRPSVGVVPFTALVTVSASPSAKPGVHSVKISVLDKEKRVVLAAATIKVIVVDGRLSGVVEKINEYRSLYKQKGAQYALLRMLWDWSGTAFTFAELKAMYEMLAGRSLSKGTVHEVLKRMLKKGLVVRGAGGYSFNPEITIDEAVRAVDVKRALSGKRGAEGSMRRGAAGAAREESPGLPAEVRKVLEKASQVAERDYWKAVDLVAHTVVGVRKTGTWLLWSGDYFIYHEMKTGLFHYFRSPALAELLRELGFREGPMLEHEKHSSEDIIHDLYGSYPNARRLHYLLKQRGWFEYPKNILLLEFYYSAGALTYILVRDPDTGSVIWEHGKREERADRVEKFPVISGEHVDEENEEAYFYRPAGLY